MASRHLARSIAMQSLYEWDFYNLNANLEEIIERNIKEFGPGLKDKSFVYELVKGVVDHFSEINEIIEKAAPQWPLAQISLVNRNVLRIGLYELLYADKKEVPPRVAINEAIELAKSFGSKTSGKFINGVLGTVYKEMPEFEEGPKEEPIKPEKKQEEILAGGVVYRRKNNHFQIVFILDAFGRWTFPKGHVEEGEDSVEALEREIKEEIGLEEIKVIKELGEREYIANEPGKKAVERKVTDFLVEASGKTEIKLEKSPGIKDAKWFSLDEIAELRRYKDCEYVLQEAINHLKGKGSLAP